ncbi:MAG: GntP family permease [Peptostreptococcaceae bacterium]
MAQGPILIVVFLASIFILLFSIIKLKVNPFLALIITAFVTAFMVGMPLDLISTEVANGFGNTLTGIGIVIGLGIILGQLLADANAIDVIANTLLSKVGDKRAPLAINFAGFLVSIPVYLDAAFVIFMPLIRQISRKTKKPLLTYVTALAVGSITAHALVIPTPGPLAVAGNMGADIGAFLFYSLVIAIPGALVGGWLYGMFIGSKNPYVEESVDVNGDSIALSSDDNLDSEVEELVENWNKNTNRPSAFKSLAVLITPILLILVGNFGTLFLEEGTQVASIVKFLGDKNVAMLIGVIVAIITLKKYFKKSVGDMIVQAAESAGLILLITGAGGAFGNIINTTGIGTYLVETLSAWNISILVLGFLLSQILRAAQGSATVALVTTSSILGPVAVATGASPVLVGLAICCGGIGLSLPNDSGFWVIQRFGQISVSDTLKSWTMGGTVSGVVSFLMILLLSLFQGNLPGL